MINAAGCDSIVTLNLTINESTTATDTHIACDSYTWIDGLTYTQSNTDAKDTLKASNGCDSIVFLNLTITTFDTSILSSAGTLISVESDAEYQWLDCESNYEPLEGETDQSFTVSEIGSYALEITKNGCRDTSSCYLVDPLVNDSGIFSEVKVYPNPTNGELFIDAENYEGVEVYDLLGRLIIQSDLTTINLKRQSQGAYVLKISLKAQLPDLRVLTSEEVLLILKL